MIIAVAALPPAAVDGDNLSPAAMTLAGCPTLTYAPTNHRHSEHATDETMVGLRRPKMSMRKP